jgi:gliding motility-associated-like protein
MSDIQKNIRYIGVLIRHPLMNRLKSGFAILLDRVILLRILCVVFLSFWGINTYSNTLKSAITQGNAGKDTTICTSDYVLQANPLNIGEIGIWTIPSGISISDFNSPAATISELSDGNIYELIWTIDNGIEQSRDTVYITYLTTTLANAGNAICKTLSFPDAYQHIDLIGNTPNATETSYWSVLSSESATNDSIQDRHNSQTVINSLEAGKHVLEYAITNNQSGCKETDQLEITIINQAIIGNTLSCFPISSARSDTVITLQGSNSASGELISWSILNTGSSSVIQSPGLPNTVVSGLSRGSHQFQYKIEHNGCSDSAQVTVTVVSKAELPGDTCALIGSVLGFNANQPTSIENALWSTNSGLFSNFTNYSSLYSNFSVGKNKIYWTIKDSSNACSSIDSLSVIGVSQPLAGNDTCIILELGQQNKTIILNKFSYAPILESVSSYSLEGDSIVGFGNNIPVTLGPGKHSFVSIITNIATSCQKKDTVVYSIINKAQAGPIQCLSEPISEVHLNAQSLSHGESGEWKAPFAISFDNRQSATTTIINPPSGILPLTWVVSNNNCKDSSSTSISIISPAQAGNDTCIVSGASYNLKAVALDKTYQSGQWSVIQGSGTIEDPLEHNTIFTPTVTGVYQVVWIVSDTNEVCSNKDTLKIVNITEPHSGDDQCISSNTEFTSINLQGNEASATETGFWVNADSVSVILSYNHKGIVSLPIGRHTLIWNIKNNNSSCIKSDTSVITIIQKANAGNDQCLIEPIASVELNASGFTGSLNSGLWKSSIPLTLNNPNQANASIENPPSGTYKLTWLVENAGCKDSSTIKVSIISKAIADSDFCIKLDSSTQQQSISSIGVNPLYQKGTWSRSENNLQSKSSFAISEPLLNVTTVSNLTIGANKFFWTVTDTSGFCSNKDSIILTAVTKPIAMDDLCLSSDLSLTTVNLSANKFATGIETGYWTNKDSTNIKLDLTNISSQELPRGVNNFYWTIENQQTGCKYLDSVAVTILPNSDAGQNLCLKEGTTPIYLNANIPNSALGETGAWKDNDRVIFSNSVDPQTNITPLISGVHTLTWLIQNNGCIDSSEVLISLLSQPQTNVDICLVDNGINNTDTLRANAFNTAYQTGVWINKSGSGIIAKVDTNKTSVENLSIGINKFIWKLTDTIGFCSLTDSLSIVIVSKAEASSAFCHTAENNQLGEVAINGSNFNSNFEKGYWTSLPNLNFNDSTLKNNSVILEPGQYKFIWNIANTELTCLSSDTIEVVMLSNPLIKENNKLPYCINGSLTPVSFLADTAWQHGGESGYWQYKNGAWNSISKTDSAKAQIDLHTDNIGIHTLHWTISNQGCSSSDSIEVSILSSPNAGSNLCIPYDKGNQTSIELKANTIDSSKEKGRWTILPGSASFFTGTLQDRDSSNATASGLLKGIDQYVWTISDQLGRCAQTDTVIYALITPPDNGPDLCKIINQGTTAVSVNLKGNTPESTETAYWSSLQPISFNYSASTTSNIQLAQGHYKILWNIGHPGLPSCNLSDTLSVTVISQAIAGEKQCLATPAVNAILLGNTIKNSSGENGTWYNVTPKSNAIIENLHDPTSKVSNLTTGAHRLKWVVSNNSCRDSSYTNLVLITKPDAGDNKCLPYEGDNTQITLTANSTTIADISNWVPAANSLSGVSIEPSKNINQVTVFNKGAYTIIYKIRDTAGVCPFLEDSTIVTVLTKPEVTAELCEKIPFDSTTKNIALNSNSKLISQESGLWTSQTINSFDKPNSVVSNALSVTTGKHHFVWTIKNELDKTCQLSDTTLVRVISQSNAGSDICLLKPVENTVLHANPATASENGFWKLTTALGQIQFDAHNPKTTVIKIPSGISTFRWYIQNETCIDSSDIHVSVQTKAYAGADFALCSDTATLSANNVANSEIGFWKKQNPNLVLTDSSNANTDIYGLKPGGNTLVWTIKNAVCENSDTVKIINNQPSIINILTPDQETCFTANILTGNKPSDEIATAKSEWKVIKQPVGNSPKVIINVPDTDSTIVRNLNAAGNYIFTYTIFNSVCDTIRDTVTITRNESLYNYAMGPKMACINDTILLEGQPIPTDGDGKWVLSSGYGTFENPFNNQTKVYDLATNQNLFYWRLKRGECENLQSVIVEGYAEPSPAIILSKNEEICQRDSLILEAVSPQIGQGEWSIVSGSATIESPTKNITKVTQLGLGRNTFKWTSSNGPCDTNSATVIIDRYAEETKADAGKDTLLCGNTLLLNANTPVSGSGSWRILQGSLNVLNPTSPTSLVTNIEYKKHILIWSIVNGTCTSSDTIVIVADEPVDQAIVQEDMLVCGQNTIQIEANVPTKGVGNWSSLQRNNLTNKASHITTVQNLPTDTSYYEWIIQRGFCKTSDTLKIINFKNPDKANAGSDQNIYNSTTYLQAAKPISGYGTWHSLNNLVEISDTTDHLAYVSNLPRGSSAFIWRVENGICPSTADTIYINYTNFKIPNAFSPNNDGKNDFFEIKGLEEYAPANIVIFNRWNQEVYSSKNYQNDWNGSNNKGKELVDDTYFYILTLSNKESHQGYIILKRN